jgi:hypothetical protein
MTKADVLNALKGKPVTFTTPCGATVNLRPISVAERMATLAWWEEHKGEQGAGWQLMAKYVALGVTDDAGVSLFTEEEAKELPISASDFDAIGEEVARRAGLMPASDKGKASPATPS